MEIIITTASILVVTATAWLLNKVWPWKICPICAGVSLTWFWMFVGVFIEVLPATNYLLLAGILMGGSIVGIAYSLEKYLTRISPLQFKVIFIPMGFIAAYSLLNFRWLISATILVLLILVLVAFISTFKASHKGESGAVKDLEDKMKNCC